MKLIKQKTKTDCLRCCLAMVLDLPYRSVPDLRKYEDGKWQKPCEKWLESLGLRLVSLGKEEPAHWIPTITVYYVNPPKTHAVVELDGRVYDPHKAGVPRGELVNRYVIVHRLPEYVV